MWFEKNYQKFLKAFHRWQAKYLKIILKFLADLNIKPNQITNFRLLLVLPLVYFLFFNIQLFWAGITYILFWVLDLFDGALARYLHVENDKGRFLDTVVDNFIYSVVILAMIYLVAANSLILAYHILIQITVQLLAIIKKREKEESNWLINAQANIPYFKAVSHIALAFYYFGLNYLNPVYLLLNIWMTITSVYYFFVIQKKN